MKFYWSNVFISVLCKLAATTQATLASISILKAQRDAQLEFMIIKELCTGVDWTVHRGALSVLNANWSLWFRGKWVLTRGELLPLERRFGGIHDLLLQLWMIWFFPRFLYWREGRLDLVLMNCFLIISDGKHDSTLLALLITSDHGLQLDLSLINNGFFFYWNVRELGYTEARLNQDPCC